MAEEIKEEIKEEVTAEETTGEAENVADTTETVDDAEPEQEQPGTPTVDLTLADGTVIPALRTNGDNLISETDIKVILTPSNLTNVKIGEAELGIMKLAGYRGYPDGYHFALIPRTSHELALEKLNAKLDYIAIMTDVEVE